MIKYDLDVSTVWANSILNHARKHSHTMPQQFPNPASSSHAIYFFVFWYIPQIRQSTLFKIPFLIIFSWNKIRGHFKQKRLDELTCLLSVSRLVLAYESSYGLGCPKTCQILYFGLGGKLWFYNIIYYNIIILYRKKKLQYSHLVFKKGAVKGVHFLQFF